jgi:hypothetical protein
MKPLSINLSSSPLKERGIKGVRLINTPELSLAKVACKISAYRRLWLPA